MYIHGKKTNKVNGGTARMKRKKKTFSYSSKSLQSKILLPFLLLILATGGVIAYTSYIKSVEVTSSELGANIEQQMQGTNNTFDMFFEAKEHVVDRFSGNSLLVNVSEKTNADLLASFEETAKSDETIMNIFMGTEKNGDMLLYPQADLPDDYDPRAREWYMKAMEKQEEVIWTEPYFDAITGDTVITVAKAVTNGNQLQGVIGVDVSVKSLVTMVNDIKIGDTGYAVVFDQNGSYVVHPDTELIGEDVSDSDYYQKILATGEQGLIDYQFEGRDKMMGFVTNETTGWKIGGTVYNEEFESRTQAIILPVAIVLLIVLIIAAVVSYFITRGVTKPIRKLQNTMKEVENGNLAVRTDIDSQDEIGELAESFEHMLSQIREMMMKISSVSDKVSNASKTLVTSSEQNTIAANEVAVTMEEIASGATSQADMMEQNTQATNTLSAIIEKVAQQNKKMHRESSELISASEQGLATVNKLKVQSDQTKMMTNDVIGAINTLDERSANISKIVSKISEISNQTNLLALNAAIEAARAGESGRGFAVVADEVRKLAEQSENALKEIADIIREIQGETGKAVTLIHSTSDVMDTQLESVNETESSFHTIHSTIQSNNKLIEQVIELMEEMVHNEKVLADNTGNISAISQQTAAGTEEVSASVEEQTASMDQLGLLASELEEHATEMRNEMNKFTYEEK